MTDARTSSHLVSKPCMSSTSNVHQVGEVQNRFMSTCDTTQTRRFFERFVVLEDIVFLCGVFCSLKKSFSKFVSLMILFQVIAILASSVSKLE